MCTVTVIPLGINGGFRVACNRDESRGRAEASPPVVAQFGGTRAAMPIDPSGGGTWIAVNGAGLVFAILNYNPVAANERKAPKSRGAVIPTLLDCADVTEAAERAESLDASHFGPFRMLVVSAESVVELLSDRNTIISRRLDRGAQPLLFTSSGLGDSLVATPRCELFAQTVEIDATPLSQDDFHRHRWADRSHLSVCMSRSDARTVSYTTVEVDGATAVMHYWPAPPNEVRRVRETIVKIDLCARRV
jgi:hypothetical protein